MRISTIKARAATSDTEEHFFQKINRVFCCRPKVAYTQHDFRLSATTITDRRLVRQAKFNSMPYCQALATCPVFYQPNQVRLI